MGARGGSRGNPWAWGGGAAKGGGGGSPSSATAVVCSCRARARSSDTAFGGRPLGTPLVVLSGFRIEEFWRASDASLVTRGCRYNRAT